MGSRNGTARCRQSRGQKIESGPVTGAQDSLNPNRTLTQRTSVISKPKNWLDVVPWSRVVEQNQQLCVAGKVAHELTPQRYDYVRKLWETAAAREIALPEALDTMLHCIKEGPFRYNNVNTFSAVARELLNGVVKQLPPVESRILVSTVSGYVESKLAKSELRQVIDHFDRQFRPSPVEATPQPAPAPVQVQPQTT